MAREVDVILKKTMIQEGKAYLSKVPVEAEVSTGKTWPEKQTTGGGTEIGAMIHITGDVTDTSLNIENRPLTN
jgi:hypothetical protein